MATASFPVFGRTIDELVGQAEAHLDQVLDVKDEPTRTYRFRLDGIRPVVNMPGGQALQWEATVSAVLSGPGVPG